MGRVFAVGALAQGPAILVNQWANVVRWEMRTRPFVLGPLASIAPDWRDPVTGLSVRHLKARLDRKAPAA